MYLKYFLESGIFAQDSKDLESRTLFYFVTDLSDVNALGLRAYISGKSLAPLLQLLHIASLSETIHIHSCDTQTPQTAVHDNLLTVTYEIVLLCVILLEKTINSHHFS